MGEFTFMHVGVSGGRQLCSKVTPGPRPPPSGGSASPRSLGDPASSSRWGRRMEKANLPLVLMAKGDTPLALPSRGKFSAKAPHKRKALNAGGQGAILATPSPSDILFCFFFFPLSLPQL